MIQPSKRREFLTSAGRWSLLAGMVWLTTVLGVRSRRSAMNPDSIRVAICSDCVEFQRCEKPKATAFRKARSRGRPTRDEEGSHRLAEKEFTDCGDFKVMA